MLVLFTLFSSQDYDEQTEEGVSESYRLTSISVTGESAGASELILGESDVEYSPRKFGGQEGYRPGELGGNIRRYSELEVVRDRSSPRDTGDVGERTRVRESEELLKADTPEEPEEPRQTVSVASGDTGRDRSDDGEPSEVLGKESSSLGRDSTSYADRISYCESGQKNAQNPVSSASGYFQFINSTWSWVTELEPPAKAYSFEVQLEAFHTLWDSGNGASHWNPSRYCWELEEPWDHHDR